MVGDNVILRIEQCGKGIVIIQWE